jgi:hypothetical protein
MERVPASFQQDMKRITLPQSSDLDALGPMNKRHATLMTGSPTTDQASQHCEKYSLMASA